MSFLDLEKLRLKRQAVDAARRKAVEEYRAALDAGVPRDKAFAELLAKIEPLADRVGDAKGARMRVMA